MIEPATNQLPPMPAPGKGDAALRGVPPPPGFRGPAGGVPAAAADRPVFTVPAATGPADAPPAEAPATARAADAAGDESPERKKLKEATASFEAFFVSYLMKQMRKTVGEGGFMAPSQGEKIFRDLMDDETARQMSTTGQMGIADLLYQELAPALKRGGEEERL